MNYYIKALKQYTVFEGRATRSEYWYFMLISQIISLILIVIGYSMGIFGLLNLIYNLGILLPTLALGARRLHDIGKTGWWQLIGLIPLIGAIVLLIFFVLDSQYGINEYGKDPKELLRDKMKTEKIKDIENFSNQK